MEREGGGERGERGKGERRRDQNEDLWLDYCLEVLRRSTQGGGREAPEGGMLLA